MMKKYFLVILTFTLTFIACEKDNKHFEIIPPNPINQYGVNTDELIHEKYSNDSTKVYFFGAPYGNIIIKGFFTKNNEQFLEFTDPTPIDFTEKIFISEISTVVDSISYKKVDKMLLREVVVGQKSVLAICFQLDYSNKDSSIIWYEYKPHNLYFFDNNIFVRKQLPEYHPFFFFAMYHWFEESIIVVGGNKNYCYSMNGDELYSVNKTQNSIGGFVEAINLHECISGFYSDGLSRVDASGKNKWNIPYYKLPGAPGDQLFERHLLVKSKSGNLWTLEHCYNTKYGGPYSCYEFTIDIETGTLQ